MCPKVSGYGAVDILRIKVDDRIIGEIYILLILFIKCNLNTDINLKITVSIIITFKIKWTSHGSTNLHF
jgi:hypothetical protein